MAFRYCAVTVGVNWHEMCVVLSGSCRRACCHASPPDVTIIGSWLHHRCPLPRFPWQALILCAFAILVFECFAVPCITTRLGVTVSNRMATAMYVPIYLAFPLVPLLHGSDGQEYAAVVILLFAAFTCCNAVSAVV